MTIAVIAIVVIVAVVAAIAFLAPHRVASEGHGHHAGDVEGQLDAETEAYREHPPGGGTGSL